MGIPWWGWLIIAIASCYFVYFVLATILSLVIAKKAGKRIKEVHDHFFDDPWKL